MCLGFNILCIKSSRLCSLQSGIQMCLSFSINQAGQDKTGPQGKGHKTKEQPGLVTKVLLEHSYTCLCLYGHFYPTIAELINYNRHHMAPNPTIFVIWPFTEKKCQLLPKEITKQKETTRVSQMTIWNTNIIQLRPGTLGLLSGKQTDFYFSWATPKGHWVLPA